ncbi:hypothetical protein L6164_012954 [Bauhinia variegata]|uniref:Uncharacterized protein n=1 Tax=Bauhinia variegata TaxID=167791 RepID=A0ACB9PBY3_BAUVA|nr:hypothetical protein L6164_012954 [Bauhinia variegata]
MHFWELFITALLPVLKVLLLTGLGTFLALERFDILREDSRKRLNTMVFFVFTPALVYGNLSDTITFKSMLMLWYMPINALLTFIIGTALGWLLIKITKTPHKLQGLVLGCCSSGNLGNLPLIIVPSLCKDSNNAFGEVEVCYRNAMAYASLSMAIGTIYIWTYTYNLVRVYSCKNSNVCQVDGSTENQLSAPKSDPEDISKCSTGQFIAAGDKRESNDRVCQLDIESTMQDGKEKVAEKKKIMEHLRTIAEKLNLKKVLTPSTIATAIGLIVGITPPFRKALVGDSAPLQVIQDSAFMIGDAAIPMMTLLLGANLLKGLKGSGVQLGLIVGIIVVKYIALPILGVGIVKGAAHFGLINHNPLYQFVLLLQYAVPPAVAISTITQLFGAGVGECSLIMLSTYVVATVSLTLWSTFFMWLVR